MSIRTILALMDGSDGSRPAMETAFALAGTFEAHVNVVHVRADPKDVVPLLGEGMSGSMIEEMFDLAEKEAVERSSRARAIFDAYCSANSVPLESDPGEGGASGTTTAWVEKTGREDEIIARYGRLSDLIVMGQSTPQADVSSAITMNAALFESGRPVLMVPAASPSPVGGKAAIAWNGSAQASRAIGAALPVLQKADEVIIMTAESDKTSVAVAPEMATYLAWHGIKAEVQTFPSAGRQVGESVLRECADAGVNLLVMGAYTHSRMRQLILGGVTRHVLAEAKIPVFLAH